MTTISDRHVQQRKAKQAQALMVEGLSTQQACDKAWIELRLFLRIADIPRVSTKSGGLVKATTMARARVAEKLILDGVPRKAAIAQARISLTSYLRCGLSWPRLNSKGL